MTPLATLAMAGCIAIGSGADQVAFRDLAAAFPDVAAVPPDTPVGLAPSPGVQRVFRMDELRRLALRFGISTEPAAEICVERPVTPPDPALFLAAMREAIPHATIEIVSFSHQPVPAGRIEFPANAVHPGATSALWSGFVKYAGNRRYSVWAQVKITVQTSRVVALQDLKPGETIDAGQVRVELRDEFPSAARFSKSIDDVVGKSPRVPIRAGLPIGPLQLRNPLEVQRGETIRVDVWNGAAHIEFDARAEASGGRGETILVRNPVSSRTFSARIEGKGRVSVDASLVKVNP